MIEVLVTMVIVVIGLAALLKMQDRLQISEVESYQRTQAMILVNDMANRIATNRPYSDLYETTTPLGTDFVCDSVTGANALQVADQTEWCDALQGAAEIQDGTRVGSLLGGRGCIEATDFTKKEYIVTVAWQGLSATAAPSVDVTGCGAGDYDVAGTECVSDKCRRYVSTVVRFADL